MAWEDSKPDDLRGHSKGVRIGIMMNLQQNVETSIKCLEVVDILEIAKLEVPEGDSVEAMVEDVEAKAMEVAKDMEAAKGMEVVKDMAVAKAMEEAKEVLEVAVEVKEALEVAVEASEAKAGLATIVDSVIVEVVEDLETVEDPMAVLEAAEAVAHMEIMEPGEVTKYYCINIFLWNKT